MTPYHLLITFYSTFISDLALLGEMQKANKEKLKKLNKQLVQAKKMKGESKILDVLKIHTIT